MQQWWDALSSADQILWGLALFSSILFILQSIMTLVGLDHGIGGHDLGHDGSGSLDHDGDGDSDSGSWGYFSVRNLVAFFLGFSWGALAFRQMFFPTGLAALCGMVVGLVFVAVSMYVMRLLSRLKSDGTISLDNAVGHEASVSLTVPAERGGLGKVMVEVQGRLMELEAETEGPALKRHERVYVLRVIDGTTLLVGQ